MGLGPGPIAEKILIALCSPPLRFLQSYRAYKRAALRGAASPTSPRGSRLDVPECPRRAGVAARRFLRAQSTHGSQESLLARARRADAPAARGARGGAAGGGRAHGCDAQTVASRDRRRSARTRRRAVFAPDCASRRRARRATVTRTRANANPARKRCYDHVGGSPSADAGSAARTSTFPRPARA